MMTMVMNPSPIPPVLGGVFLYTHVWSLICSSVAGTLVFLVIVLEKGYISQVNIKQVIDWTCFIPWSFYQCDSYLLRQLHLLLSVI